MIVQRVHAGHVFFDKIDRGIVKIDRLSQGNYDFLDKVRRLKFGSDNPADLVEEVGFGKFSIEKGLKVPLRT